jgi:hypothetical protein
LYKRISPNNIYIYIISHKGQDFSLKPELGERGKNKNKNPLEVKLELQSIERKIDMKRWLMKLKLGSIKVKKCRWCH